MKTSSLLLVIAASVVAVSIRLVDRPMMNFSAMGALAVLCGAVVRPAWLAILIPLACRGLTDCVLEYRTGHGFYGSMLFDYAAYAAMFFVGRTMQPRNLVTAFEAGLLAAATFFLVSNIGVWCMPHEGQYLYSRTFSGLLTCLANGLPFAKGTLIGDVGFTLAFFGAHHWASATAAKPVTSEG